MPIINFDKFDVELTLKKVKNLSLRILPPEGIVKVTAPLLMPPREVVDFIKSKEEWILKNQQKIRSRHEDKEKEFITGETHYLFGRPYVLEIVGCNATPEVTADSLKGILTIRCSPKTTKAQRAALLLVFYKNELQKIIDRLMNEWVPIMKESSRPVTHRVEMMRRQWGKCYPRKRDIVFSLLLARAHPQCIEYVVVHELTHLRIPGHQKNFHEAMERFLPRCKELRKALRNLPPSPWN